MKIEIKKVKNLTKREKSLINKNRKKEFGKKSARHWRKDPATANIFFLKENKDVVAFGMLIPIKIKYLKKDYNILGICSIISIKKRKGYGKILIQSIVNYLKKKGKTGIGFFEEKNLEFYKKTKLKIKKKFVKRFMYIDPKTGKNVSTKDEHGIYLEGKDNFIKRILSTKSKIQLGRPYW